MVSGTRFRVHLGQVTPLDFNMSVGAFGIEIGIIKSSKNRFTEQAEKRGEFFLLDEDIPLPRPCTALAWASLCMIERAQKRTRFWDQHVAIPILPVLRPDDAQSLSLSRQSKAHIKDEDGRIFWGLACIGDSLTGDVLFETKRTDFIAGQVSKYTLTSYRIGWRNYIWPIPPLWANYGESWQFGVVQHPKAPAMQLRTPFEMLAERGIPLTHNFPTPTINRLLFRFANPHAVIRWMRAYADAMDAISYQDSWREVILADQEKLKQEIRTLLEQRRKEAESKLESKTGKRIASFDMSGFDTSTLNF